VGVTPTLSTEKETGQSKKNHLRESESQRFFTVPYLKNGKGNSRFNSESECVFNLQKEVLSQFSSCSHK